MTETTVVLSDRIAVTRSVAAPAHAIFRLVTDPARHVEIDGSGMLRGLTSGVRISGVGDKFIIEMDRRPLGDIPGMAGYAVECTVTKLIADELVEWTVRAIGKPPAGHCYGWQMEPLSDTTSLVTNYCDWTHITEALRTKFRWPVVPIDRLERSIENLARLATGQALH